MSYSHSKKHQPKKVTSYLVNKDHLFVLQSRKRNFVFILYSNKCFWNSSVLCKQISTFWDFTIYPGLCVLHGLEILHALVSHNFVEKNPHHRLKKICMNSDFDIIKHFKTYSNISAIGIYRLKRLSKSIACNESYIFKMH